MMHSHWLLSHSVLNKMMNNTERESCCYAALLKEILKGLCMQCASQPVCDVTLGDTTDLDGEYIMHFSMLKRLKLSHDLFS